MEDERRNAVWERDERMSGCDRNSISFRSLLGRYEEFVMIEGITNTLFIWTVTSIPIPSTHIQQAWQSHTPFAHIQRDHSVILLIIERIQIHRDGLQLHELPLLGENAQMKRHGGLSRRPVKVVVKLRE